MFHEESFFGYLSLERRFSSHTLTAYRNDLAQFITFLTDKQCLTSVAEVRHSHIRAWIVQYMQAGQSARSINRRLSCLKSYFKYLKKRGWVPKDPMQKVVAPKTGKKLPVFVPEHQMAALFAHVEFGDGYTGLLHRILIETLYATGMRRSELTGLMLTDVDLGRSVFRVKGKGGKERMAPFARYLSVLLEQYLDARKGAFPDATAKALFIHPKGAPVNPDYVYRIVRKYLSMATTVERRSPHVLRHSFATHLSNEGADLNAIKELLGHANLAATQIYMHNSIEKLRKVYEQAHPKGSSDDESEDL
jgi:integrase/recombinase XerC